MGINVKDDDDFFDLLRDIEILTLAFVEGIDLKNEKSMDEFRQEKFLAKKNKFKANSFEDDLSNISHYSQLQEPKLGEILFPDHLIAKILKKAPSDHKLI